MSNFCGVISNEPSDPPTTATVETTDIAAEEQHQISVDDDSEANYETEKPLTFEDLDIIINWLQSESEELHEEFVTKSQFLSEQQKEIVTIHDSVLSIHEQMTALHNGIAEIEQTLLVNDECMRRLELYANSLNRSVLQTDTLGISGARIYPERQRNEHEYVFSQLEQLNVMMERLSTVLTEMTELKEKQQLRHEEHPCFNEIVAVLDFQVHAMEQLDESINKLLIKAENVDNLLARTTQKCERTCKMYTPS